MQYPFQSLGLSVFVPLWVSLLLFSCGVSHPEQDPSAPSKTCEMGPTPCTVNEVPRSPQSDACSTPSQSSRCDTSNSNQEVSDEETERPPATGDESNQAPEVPEDESTDEAAADESEIVPDTTAEGSRDHWFHEDFESRSSLESWHFEGDTVLSEEADGNHAIRVRAGPSSTGGRGSAKALLNKIIERPSDQLYLRWRMKFRSLALPAPHPYFVTLAPADYDISNGFNYRTNSFSALRQNFAITVVGEGIDKASLWKDGEPANQAGDSTPESEHHLRAQEWFCVVMHFDATRDTLVTQIDGSIIETLTIHPSVFGSGRGKLLTELNPSIVWFGVRATRGHDYEIWYDDIAISEHPIGCE